jgi:acetyl esterase/lipase
VRSLIEAANSWGPVWSPDGSRLAYYSDEGGEAGLWVYQPTTDTRHRIGSFVVRPDFASDVPVWVDGQHILVKSLSAGQTLRRVNAFAPLRSLRIDATALLRKGTPTALAVGDNPEFNSSGAVPGVWETRRADLLVANIANGTSTKLASSQLITGYTLSPSHGEVAYTAIGALGQNSQQASFNLAVLDLASGRQLFTRSGLSMRYGDEFSWSDDGSKIALLDSDEQRGSSVIVVRPVGPSQVASRVVAEQRERQHVPIAMLEQGTPYWSNDGGCAFFLVGEELKCLNVATGQVRQFASLSNLLSPQVVAQRANNLIIFGVAKDDRAASIITVDERSGSQRTLWRGVRKFIHPGNAAIDLSGNMAFLAEDSDHPADVWLLPASGGPAAQLSHLNPIWENRSRSEVRRIGWKSEAGAPLEGLLMMPEGYKGNTRAPTIVFVYGGATGEASVNRFGLGWGDAPTLNFAVLTSRGYAVFLPDLPVHTGTPTADFMSALMPSLNALAASGAVDTDRLAIMGQSYGSYTAWSVITRTRRFKAAITSANVIHPDLLASYLNLPRTNLADWGYFENGQGAMGGSPWQFPDRYRANSPVFDLDKIMTPLLMGQGDEDGDLKPSDAMFAALQRLGKPVKYIVYHGEAHVISYAPNVIDWWRRRLEFLSEQLNANSAQTSPSNSISRTLSLSVTPTARDTNAPIPTNGASLR